MNHPRPTPIFDKSELEERRCHVCGTHSWLDDEARENGHDSYHTESAARWACPACTEQHVAKTHCDVCLEEYTDTGVLTGGGVHVKACMSCEPSEFGLEFAVRELRKPRTRLSAVARANEIEDMIR